MVTDSNLRKGPNLDEVLVLRLQNESTNSIFNTESDLYQRRSIKACGFVALDYAFGRFPPMIVSLLQLSTQAAMAVH